MAERNHIDIIPSGCKRYFFNALMQYVETDNHTLICESVKGRIVLFRCIASNVASAQNKFANFLEAVALPKPVNHSPVTSKRYG